MRNVILAAVAITALAVAGLGGTLAGWSDSEISHDNYIETGSLDLQVNGADDPLVPTKVMCDCMIPCCENCWSEQIELHNVGQCCSGEVFIHFKEFCCSDVVQEKTGVDPEPEVVCRDGGWVDQVLVPGLGEEPCELSKHILVTVYEKPDLVTPILEGKMFDLKSLQISLGILGPCETMELVILFHLQNVEDPEWEVRGLPEKFKDWPTNCLMKDKLTFNIEFDLLQVEKVV